MSNRDRSDSKGMLGHQVGYALALFGALFCGGLAEARFYHVDAEEVDAEQRFGSEAFLDIASYALPVIMTERFRLANNGARISAGSLDQARFYYQEQVRVTSPSFSPIRVRFEREKFQDVAEEWQKNDLLLEVFYGPLFCAYLLDGDSWKKWGDMGIVCGAEEKNRARIEFYYINVDIYYPSKELIKGDSYEESPWTIGTRGVYLFGDLAANWRYEYDRPLVWQRQSEGYRYHYERRQGHLTLDLPLGKVLTYHFSYQEDQKRERKYWIYTSTPDFFKTMNRHHWQVDNALSLEAERNRYTLGVQRLHRDVDYEGAGEPHPDLAVRFMSHPDTVRSEWLAYGRWLRRSAPTRSWLTGFYFSESNIDQEELSERDRYEGDALDGKTEIKLQTAFLYHLSETSQLYFNANWNIDRLIDHFPYDEKAFRPWNGGQIAAQIVL